MTCREYVDLAKVHRHRVRACAVAALVCLVAVATTSCGWKGIANLPVPGGPGTSSHATTIYVQIPDTLALNVNSRVRLNDVTVGRVRAIELKNWVATLTLDLDPGIRLPTSTRATIGQTTLLGTQHLELTPPSNVSSQMLESGQTIPLEHSSAFPTTELTLASIGTILSGGGIPDLDTIQNEVFRALDGHGDQIRSFVGRLDTFTASLNDQRADLSRAIDSTNRLLMIVAQRNDTLNRVLTEIPPLVEHFADTRDLIGDAVVALGRVSEAATDALTPAHAAIHANLQNLQRPLVQLGKASPYLIGALKMILSGGFSTDNVAKAVRGDYINASLNIDLTLSAIDNAFLTGTGVSGLLRALEQSWGRDPNTMIPDLRFTPNPHDAPGGPLVERGE